MFELVHQEDDGWYFWDEIGDLVGPYPSEFHAHEELVRYCLWLDYGDLILGPNHLRFAIPERANDSPIDC